jgi:hypothetical protein
MMIFSPSSSRDIPHSLLPPDRKHQKPRQARASRLLPWLASAVVACAVGSGAAADEKSGPFATVCALKEVKVITLIEDHGEAQDLPSDSLGDAGLAMLRARSACYEGRVGDALALYDGILSLGPVVSLRKP